VLRPGEVDIDRTLAQHIRVEAEILRQYSRQEPQAIVDGLWPLAEKVWRGVYKPCAKAFGFEAHEDHLEDLLRIAVGTAHMDALGHEIPLPLNMVDPEVRQRFGGRLLRQAVRNALAERGVGAFFEEMDEHALRD
jgi:hypothetical protein